MLNILVLEETLQSHKQKLGQLFKSGTSKSLLENLKSRLRWRAYSQQDIAVRHTEILCTLSFTAFNLFFFFIF